MAAVSLTLLPRAAPPKPWTISTTQGGRADTRHTTRDDVRPYSTSYRGRRRERTFRVSSGARTGWSVPWNDGQL